jgi:hypothetical protein
MLSGTCANEKENKGGFQPMGGPHTEEVEVVRQGFQAVVAYVEDL